MADLLDRNRRSAFVGFAVVAAIVTPPDPFPLLKLLAELICADEVVALVSRWRRW